MLSMYTLGMMGMMGMMGNTGNVHQKYYAKYGYGADFRNRPQANTYSTEIMPIPQPNEVKKIPVDFWSGVGKFYYL